MSVLSYKKITLISALVGVCVFSVVGISVAYEKFAPGSDVTIGEFVYDDDFVATTTDCTISISNPAHTEVVNTTMSTTTNGNGWHYYTYSSANAEGLWPTVMTCGAPGVDRTRIDKSFMIGYDNASTSAIAQAVWNNNTTTLTSTASLVSDIWNYTGRTVTTLANVFTDIWGGATRTLSSFGNLVSDVWSHSTRRLTDKTLTNGGELATESQLQIATSTITSQLQSATSTIIAEIQSNRTLIQNLNNISAADVWGYGTRELTSSSGGPVELTVSSTEAVWKVAKSQLTTANSIGKHIVDNLDAAISSRSILTAADVWSNVTRTLSETATSEIALRVWSEADRSLSATGNDLTAAAVWNVLSSTLAAHGSDTIGKQLAQNVVASTTIAQAVWNNTTRTLSSFGTLIADIWGYTGGRTLSSLGNAAADVWNATFAPTRRLTDATLTGGGSIATQQDVTNSTNTITGAISSLNNISASDVWSYYDRSLTNDASSSIAAKVWENPTRALTTYGTLVSDIWANNQRTLTDYAASSIASTVWSNNSRLLTGAALTDGGMLATESYINTATSSIIVEVLQNRSLISALNNISAADVWAYGSRSLNGAVDLSNASRQAIWDTATSALSASGSIGKLFVDNLDAKVSTRGTSNLTAADVWDAANRTLTDYSTTSIALGVWSNAARTLTNYGNNITAADVWNVMSSSLTTVGTIGNKLANLNDISALDIWNSATSTMTTSGSMGKIFVDNLDAKISSRGTSNLSAVDVWNVATNTLSTMGTTGKLIVDNLDAQISSRGISNMTAADVWSAATRTLTDYSTTSIALGVWSNAARTLTNYGNNITAADVWNVMSSSLTTVGTIGNQLSTNADVAVSTRASLSGQQSGWHATMSNVDSLLAGKTYRAKVFVANYEMTPTNPFAAPKITIYDANRNAVITDASMSNSGLPTGVYEYTYAVDSGAAPGLWESVVTTEIVSGKNIITNDYWVVESSPARVFINGMNSVAIPNIEANVTITNEGLVNYEYHYDWCVVTDVANSCGGNDDIYFASGSELINVGESWNTNLTATVPNPGYYYFKLLVHYGTEVSGASRFFTTEPPPNTNTNTNTNTGSSSGGGGGGGPVVPPVVPTTCNGADFNHDHFVNSIDFSILLAFWKTVWPFRNPCVDINVDKQVNSVDFSILMFQWGSKR